MSESNDERIVADRAAVIARAVQLSGRDDAELIAHWFNHVRLNAFSGLTPRELVEIGRTDSLLAYIDSLNAGSLG